MTSTSKRKRRIRKKLYLDEFAVYVFELKIDLSTSYPEEELVFLDDLIYQLEGMKLLYMGYFLETKLRGHIIAKGRYNSPTEFQRQYISDWCQRHSSIKEFEFGSFENAYYPNK